VPLAIPHSVFLGRIVRPGRDPQWTPEDRGYALAWQADKRATCSCGTREDEWAEDRDAYVGATAYCRGHDVLAMAQESLPKDKDGRPLPGFIAHLERREVAEARAKAKADN
jgi:hypothetical protein